MRNARMKRAALPSKFETRQSDRLDFSSCPRVAFGYLQSRISNSSVAGRRSESKRLIFRRDFIASIGWRDAKKFIASTERGRTCLRWQVNRWGEKTAKFRNRISDRRYIYTYRGETRELSTARIRTRATLAYFAYPILSSRYFYCLACSSVSTSKRYFNFGITETVKFSFTR